MAFKNTRFQLISRIALLALFIFGASWAFISGISISTGIFLLLMAAMQVMVIIYHIEKTQRDVVNLLGFIQYDDFSVTYPAQKHSGVVKRLYEEYNKVIKKFRQLRSEKESNLHFFRSILQHIDIGILAFNQKGEIKIINTSALRLINLSQLNNLSRIEVLYPDMYSTFLTLPSYQKAVFKLESVSISVSALEMTIYGEDIRLISLHNIQSELEEKEMEAWQNMIRVMTHEIMNSLTPITSLAATIADDMSAWNTEANDDKNISAVNAKELYMAISTIKKRSEGLMHFVEDFRNLSQIPKPKPHLFAVKELLDHLLLLLKKEIDTRGAVVNIILEPETLHLMADFKLVEQIMINLIKNAFEAFSSSDRPMKIEIRAFYNRQSMIEIWVKDDGDGIEKETLEKVFIPFYSTKKTGSGIGLTISKQIMKMHNGTIRIQSKKGEGTLVKLVF